MKFYNRKTVCADLPHYCHLAKPNTIVEVTEWHNGEGWDVWLGDRHLQLTWGELQALTVLCNVKHLEQNND